MPLGNIYSKLLKGNVMRNHPVLRRHLPETRRFKQSNLARMQKRFSTLFIKPDTGRQGDGIIRVKHAGNRHVQISKGLRHWKVRKRDVGRTIKKLIRRKGTYLIQQGLPLAKYKNRLIDIRVFMQKPASTWLVSGEVVRVGAAGRFVTNYHKGGKPAYLKSVLHSIYKNQPNKVNRMIREIEKISMISSKVLNRKFPKNRQWGVDIALDKNGRLWIIESNASPAFLTFMHLKDKTMYNRILRRKHHIRSKYSRG